MVNKKHVDIHPYTGYGNKNKIYCYGRILKKRFLYNHKNVTKWHSFINALKRIESDEIPNCEFVYKIGNHTKRGKTNSEGFYHISDELSFDIDSHSETIAIEIKKDDINNRYVNDVDVCINGKILFPKQDATIGVISDIDDTVLKTDVLSKFKWRVLYNTLFLSAKARKEITGTSLWYQKLHDHKNPFFYISNSPWNLYDYLYQFLSENHFPEGPVLLRDFGKEAKDALQDYRSHKINEVEKIVLMYPMLPFVLIGDGGERDADIYLEIAKKFPSQIKAIFIHRLGDAKYQARIEQLVTGHEKIFFFIKDAVEATEISQNLKLINYGFPQKLKND
jgi:phosphatidate phosphatase APP1